MDIETRIDRCVDMLKSWILTADTMTTDKGLSLTKRGATTLSSHMEVMKTDMYKIRRQLDWYRRKNAELEKRIEEEVNAYNALLKEVNGDPDDEEELTEEDFWMLQEMCNG